MADEERHRARHLRLVPRATGLAGDPIARLTGRPLRTWIALARAHPARTLAIASAATWLLARSLRRR